MISNVWEGRDFTDHRAAISAKWLSGAGIEIGGLHKPVKLPEGASVKYVDLRTHEEANQLNAHEVLVPDIVDNGFLLLTIEDSSVDFIIGNHLLEHCPDFYGTIERWVRKLKSGGVIYSALPIVDRCFDNGRVVTEVDHIIEDHARFAAGDIDGVVKITRTHLLEFALVSGRNILKKKNETTYPTYDAVYAFVDRLVGELRENIGKSSSWDDLIRAHGEYINKKYDLHYHAFLPSTIESLLNRVCEAEGLRLEDLRKSGGGEVIFVLRKL